MTEKRKSPALRFRGYTDDWEQRKLGELSSSFEYGLNAAAKEYDGENKYIRITDIDDDSREFKQEDITSPDTDLSSTENYKLSEGDILLARTGASVGKSYIYKASDGLVYYAGFLIRARIKTEYNSEFVFQNTLTGDYEKFIKVTSMRSGQPGVNAQEYSQYQIMMPSKPEQDKISDCLRNLDNLITLHQRKLEKLKLVKKSMLEKMFPKNGSSVPEIRFNGFTDDWEQRKFGDLYTPLTERNVELLPYSRTLSVATMEYKASGNGAADSSLANYKRLRIGDIAFEGHTSKEFRYGRFVLNDAGDGIMSPRFSALRPLVQMPTKFWKYYIHYEPIMRNVLVNSTKAGTMMNELVVDEFLKSSILVPSEGEQTCIGNALTTLDNLITLHQRKVEKLQIMKKSMLEKMFV